MKKYLIIFIIFWLPILAIGQSKNFGAHLFISADKQDTIFVNSPIGTISGLDSIEVGGIWYSDFSSGGSVNYGTEDQLPVVNSTGDGFDYSPLYKWDGIRLILEEPGDSEIGNLFIGLNSGSSGQGQINIGIGENSLNSLNSLNSDVLSNIAIGYNAGTSIETGSYNTILGSVAGSSLPINATSNTLIGHGAGQLIGDQNVVIGRQGGATATGDGNVFIGYQSGYSYLGDNKLIIENSDDVTTPLIFGDFVNNIVKINDTLEVSVVQTDTLFMNGTALGLSDVTGDETYYNAIISDNTTLDNAILNNTGNWLISDSIALNSDKTLPNNITLHFIGGMINFNGYDFNGDNTSIVASKNKIFQIGAPGHLGGTWNVNKVYPEWFGTPTNPEGSHVDATRELQEMFYMLTLSGGGTAIISNDYWVRPLVLTGDYGSQAIDNSRLTGELYPTRDNFNSVIIEGNINVLGINSPEIRFNNEWVDDGGGSTVNNRLRGIAFYVDSGDISFKNILLNGEMPMYTSSLNSSNYCNNTVDGANCWDLTHKAINTSTNIRKFEGNELHISNTSGEMIHGGWNVNTDTLDGLKWNLENCSFTNCYGSAFSVGGFKSVRFTEFNYCAANATEHIDNQPFIYANNKFYNCNSGIASVGYTGATGADPDKVTAGSSIHNNLFYNCGSQSGAGVSLCVQLTTGVQAAKSLLITDNIFVDCDRAINAFQNGGLNITITNNKFTVDRRTPDNPPLSGSTNYKYCTIDNNVFERTDYAVDQGFSFNGIIERLDSSTFRNNTFKNVKAKWIASTFGTPYGYMDAPIFINSTPNGSDGDQVQNVLWTGHAATTTLTVPISIVYFFGVNTGYNSTGITTAIAIDSFSVPQVNLMEGNEIKFLVRIGGNFSVNSGVLIPKDSRGIQNDRPRLFKGITNGIGTVYFLTARVVKDPATEVVSWCFVDDDSWSSENLDNKTMGATSERPDLGVFDNVAAEYIGFRYYDTDLRQEVVWDTLSSGDYDWIRPTIDTIATIDFASIAANSQDEETVTLGDITVADNWGVTATPMNGIEAGLSWSAYVSAENTITIRLINTTGSAIDPASRLWSISAKKIN